MSVVPDKQSAKISFYVTHLPPFTEHAEQIGTTPELVAQLAAQTEAARAAYTQASQARQAARSATARLHDALAAMEVTGQAIIKQVRARAATAGDGIYSLAQLPPPADPSPVGKPGTPGSMNVELGANGELTLRWTCRNPNGGRGVIYQIYRRDGHGGAFQFLGSAGRRRFVDETVPVGASTLTYRIRATRSTGAGEAAEFGVNLGVDAASAALLAMAVRPREKGKLAA